MEGACCRGHFPDQAQSHSCCKEGSSLLGPFILSGHLCHLPGPAHTSLREREGSESKGWG